MKLTFEGETLTELVQQMQGFLVETGNWWNAPSPAPVPDEVPGMENPTPTPAAEEEPVKRKPGRPKKTPPTAPIVGTAPEEEPEVEEPAPPEEEKVSEEEKHPLDFDAIRSAAITKLMTVYNMGGAYSTKVKGVLKEFGVAKFAEVPDEKLNDLLTRAVELESEAA
jgi:hypothetical protein